MKKNKYNEIVFYLVAAVILLLSFLIVRPLLTPLLFGIILAYLFYPLYNFLRAKMSGTKLAGRISAWLVVLTVMLAVLVPAFVLIFFLIGQSENILNLVMGLTNQISLYLHNRVLAISQQNLSQFGVHIDLSSFDSGPLFKFIGDGFLNFARGFLTQIPILFFGSFITLFIVYYLLRSSADIEVYLQKILPFSIKQFRSLQCRFDLLVRGLLFSQGMIALIQSILAFAAFLVVGFADPFLLAALILVLALIPFAGAFIVWVPLAAQLFVQVATQGAPLWKPIFLTLWGMLVISSIDNVLRPKFMSDVSGIHPAVMLIGIIGGMFLFGLPGILLGPFILEMVGLLIEIYQKHK